MNRIAAVCVCIVLTVSAAAADADTDSSDFTICLVPLGKHDRRVVAPVVRGIEQLYGVKVKRLAKRALPKSAYYKPRRRYRAEKLLAYLESKVFPRSGCSRVIGLTSVDISTTKGEHKDWGIFGLAHLGGPSGVVSTFRLRRRANRRKLTVRAIKVVNHEIGHTLGSEHVDEKGCLMEDGAGTIKTVDGETGLLCPGTIKVIERATGLVLPELSAFDWDQAIKPPRDP